MVGEDKAKTICYPASVDEGRKRTILIAASILVARKWEQLGGSPSSALDAAITDAITLAKKIMRRIDSRAATPPDQCMTLRYQANAVLVCSLAEIPRGVSTASRTATKTNAGISP